MSSETDALGGVTSYAYDAAGNVLSVTDAENHSLRYEYDEMNRRTAVIDGNGRGVRTSFDLAGHPIAITNAANETVSTAYDPIGRPVAVTDPHGYVSTFAYDANNNRLCAIDANASASLQPKNTDNCTVSTQYDELNRPILTRDALNGTTSTSYDLLGNPLTRIDAEGRRYTWAYDGLGRLTTETDVAGQSTTYALDQAGNAYQKTNRLNEATRITYDTLNRPTNVAYLKDGTTEALAYDPAGNLASAANNTVGYSFTYDTLNRLASKIDSRGRSLSFTWDRSGHVLTKTTYQGATTSYTYDGAGTLVSLSNPDYLSVNYQYDDGGRLLSRVMSSGARSLYAYDTGGWLTSLAHFDATDATVAGQSYTRDRVGNIVALNVTVGAAPGTTSYTYDALYRLASADFTGTANDEAFSYDRIGNRLTQTRGGTSIGAPGSTTKYSIYTAATQTGSVPGYTPTYNHRLAEIRIGSVGGALESSFVFDNEGRLTSQTGSTPRTLTWDAKGRLKTLTQSGTTETYAYDPSNHRIGRSGGTVGNLDYYLEGEHLESVEQGGTLLERYFRGSTVDELVAGYVMQGNKLVPYFFQHDQVMSVSAVTKPNGGTQATMSYRAFGETLATTGTPISRIQYTGRENDGNGLYFYRARTFDPVIGRFISEDPLKFAAGANFYAYVNNNPVNGNDPGGLCGPNCAGAIWGGFAGGTGGGITGYQTDGVWGGVKGAGIGTVVGAGVGLVTPWLSRQAGVVAAAGLTGMGSSAAGQFASNRINNQPLGTNFSYFAVAGAGIGNAAAILPAKLAGTFAGEAAGVSIPFGSSSSLTIMTPEVQASAGVAKSLVEGMFGGFFEGGFDEIGKAFFPTPAIPQSNVVPGVGGSTGFEGSFNDMLNLDPFAAGGFLLYPNKPNTNQMQSVYRK